MELKNYKGLISHTRVLGNDRTKITFIIKHCVDFILAWFLNMECQEYLDILGNTHCTE